MGLIENEWEILVFLITNSHYGLIVELLDLAEANKCFALIGTHIRMRKTATTNILLVKKIPYHHFSCPDS